MFLFHKVCVLLVVLFIVQGVTSRIIPPKRLSNGETPIRDPGWTCVVRMRAALRWKRLKSPNYPNLAGSQTQCTWIIQAAVGWRVMISFRDVNMAAAGEDSCRQQYVDVIDASIGKSQGRFCGKKRPGNYVSSGTFLRLDLQTDRTRGRFRGFSIAYKLTKEVAGFRPSTVTTTDTTSGKVNVNSFNSQVNSMPSQGRRLRPPGRLVYVQSTPAGQTTTTASTDPSDVGGWIDSRPAPTQPTRTNTAGGARIPARPRRPTTTVGGLVLANRRRSTSSPRRIPGSVSSNTFSSNGGALFRSRTTTRRIPSSVSSNTFSSNGGALFRPRTTTENLYASETEYPHINDDPQVYGEYRQPGNVVIPSVITTNDTLKRKGGGLSTTHLIIIIAAVSSLVLLAFAILLIKRCYFDKKLRKKISEDKAREAAGSVTGNSLHRNDSLPGMARTVSMHSLSADPSK
ncbi:uncharacterized protein LOC100178074 [Ciona intestinalis]